MTQARADRLNSILAFIREGGLGGVTLSEIARELGIKRSPYLVGLVDQVVGEGYAFHLTDDGVWPPTRRYFVTEVTAEVIERD